MTDQICTCGHWGDEHSPDCAAPGCYNCTAFEFSPEQNAAAEIADRGGLHDLACACAWCITLTPEQKACMALDKTAIEGHRLNITPFDSDCAQEALEEFNAIAAALRAQLEETK